LYFLLPKISNAVLACYVDITFGNMATFSSIIQTKPFQVRGSSGHRLSPKFSWLSPLSQLTPAISSCHMESAVSLADCVQSLLGLL
jgi:hypothetical protein